MTDERHDAAPPARGGDDPLEREIRRLLAVDPSPAFEARVRARVAAEPAPNAWRAGRLRMVLGAAAATAAVVLAVVVSRLDPPGDTGAEPAGMVAGAGDAAPPSSGDAARRADEPSISDLASGGTAEPDTATGPAAPGARLSGPRRAAPPAPAARPPGPPRFTRVVFSESERAALRRLLAQARDRPVIVPAPAEAAAPTAGEPPRELVVPPIAIDPPAEVVVPPISVDPPITIEPLNVVLLDTGADQ